jgi:hypothetical protein
MGNLKMPHVAVLIGWNMQCQVSNASVCKNKRKHFDEV